MTDPTDAAVPPGLADLPLEVRRAQEMEAERVIREGIARRHLAVTADERAYTAVHFDGLLRAGPALAAALRGG
jgi:hypothetical protein